MSLTGKTFGFERQKALWVECEGSIPASARVSPRRSALVRFGPLYQCSSPCQPASLYCDHILHALSSCPVAGQSIFRSMSSTRRRSQPLKRSYVACIPCRTRKVKCIIQSQPPCAKCEREHRECRFDVHERSWKHRDTPKWAGKATDNISTEKSEASTTAEPALPSSDPYRQQSLPAFSETSTSPTGAQQAASPSFQAPIVLDHTTTPTIVPRDDTANSASPSFTDRVVSSMVTGPGDALEILFDAAKVGNASSLPMGQPHGVLPQLEFTSHPIPVVSQLSYPHDDVLDLWDRCRFVRQGWFTAQEAVTYIDLYVA